MAKQGNKGNIGEANVIITGDITDLKKSVADAKKEVEGVGKTKTGRRVRGSAQAAQAGQSGSATDPLGDFRGFRRAIGIGTFIAGVSAAFFTLGKAIREAITSTRQYQDAQIESGRLASKSAEEEAAAREKISEELATELAAFRDGTLIERIIFAIGQASRGRRESVLENLLKSNENERAIAANRLASERTRNERIELMKVNQRILEALENFREQQRQATDRALAQQQVAASRLEAIIELRAGLQRR